jgi:Flp pilus assembly protein CpaB
MLFDRISACAALLLLLLLLLLFGAAGLFAAELWPATAVAPGL